MKNLIFTLCLIMYSPSFIAQDVGFDPFIGVTTSQVNFRSGPSTTYSAYRLIEKNSPVYIFSNTSYNGFYKAIDVKLGMVGWVSTDYIKWYKEVDTTSSGGFRSNGDSAEYNPELKITNRSTSTITLVIGEETFYINPNSTISRVIAPGNKNYVATAPGVIPNSGYKVFEAYKGYEWEFWIETRRR